MEPSVDTLGRWMAHYIADLMEATETSSIEERLAVQKRCFEAILDLWKHRSALPNGRRPFEELEPVIRALESLDPNDDTPRYFRSGRPPADIGEQESEAHAWLEIADGLDYSAKLLIGYCLSEAAGTAIDKSKDWVALAEAAGTDPGIGKIIVHFISSKTDLGKTPDPSELIREQLTDRIKRLEAFTKMAAELSSNLVARLKTLPPPK